MGCEASGNNYYVPLAVVPTVVGRIAIHIDETLGTAGDVDLALSMKYSRSRLNIVLGKSRVWLGGWIPSNPRSDHVDFEFVLDINILSRVLESSIFFPYIYFGLLADEFVSL